MTRFTTRRFNRHNNTEKTFSPRTVNRPQYLVRRPYRPSNPTRVLTPFTIRRLNMINRNLIITTRNQSRHVYHLRTTRGQKPGALHHGQVSRTNHFPNRRHPVNVRRLKTIPSRGKITGILRQLNVSLGFHHVINRKQSRVLLTLHPQPGRPTTSKMTVHLEGVPRVTP